MKSANLGFDQYVHGGPRAGAAHARFAGARSATAEFTLSAICSVIQSGGKPANVRLVAAAIRDTREVWASYFLPQDRAHMIELLAGLPKRVPGIRSLRVTAVSSCPKSCQPFNEPERCHPITATAIAPISRLGTLDRPRNGITEDMGV